MLFLNVLLIQKHSKFEATVYKKSANTDIYLNWQSFAPNTSKSGTLKKID